VTKRTDGVPANFGPIPGTLSKPLEAAKRAVLRAPRDDALRQRRPDTRQSRDLRHVGVVQINFLTGESGRESCAARRAVRAARGRGPQTED